MRLRPLFAYIDACGVEKPGQSRWPHKPEITSSNLVSAPGSLWIEIMRLFEITQGSVWSEVERSGTITDGIAAAEASWIGSIADFGDHGAALHVSAMPGYRIYQQALVKALQRHIGFPLRLYRIMPTETLEAYLSSPWTDVWATSLSERFARNFAKFAGQKNHEALSLFQISAGPQTIIMRGKQDEAEIVIDPYELDLPDAIVELKL